MISSTMRSRERVLIYGSEGCGKTTAALHWAREMPGTVWIIDNDNSLDRLLETEFTDLHVKEEWRNGNRDHTYEQEDGRLVVFHCHDWTSAVKALEQIRQRSEFNDLCIIDTASALWEDVQAWFAEQAHGKSMEDWLIDFRLNATKEKATAAEAQFLDWGFINPQYLNKVGDFFMNPPCHLISTAEAKSLSATDESQVRSTYNFVGVKPAGQKRIGYQHQTVLFVARDSGGNRTITTVKERGRDELDRAPLTNFVSDYLVAVAGWKRAIAKKGQS